MTACTNNGGSRARRAVTAALVGVLSVGAAPMVALATGAPSGEVQLQATAGQDFSLGHVVDAYDQNNVKLDLDNIEFVAGNAENQLKVTRVVTGSGTPVTSGLTVSFANWSDSNEDGKVTANEVSGTVDITTASAGNYAAVISSTDPAYAGGTIYLPVKIVNGSLKDATIFDVNASDANDVSDTTFNYTGSRQTFYENDLGVALDGKPLTYGTDYTVKCYDAKGQEATPEFAGDYTAVITGVSTYANSSAKVSFKIEQFDLSKTVVKLNGSAIKFDNNGHEATISSVEGWDGADFSAFDVVAEDGVALEKGTYNYTVKVTDSEAVSDKVKASIANEAKATIDVVDHVVDATGFKYGNQALADRTINLSNENHFVFDASKLNATTNDGKKVPAEYLTVEVMNKATGEVSNDTSLINTPGTWVVTVKVDAEAAEHVYGGSSNTVTYTVVSGVVQNATMLVTYNGVTANSFTGNQYNGEDFLDDIKVTVYDSNKNLLTEGEDYTVIVTKDGKAVDSIVDQGTYTISVESDTYKINKGAVATFKVDPVTLLPNTVRVLGTFNDEHVFLPYTGDIQNPGYEWMVSTGKDGKANTKDDVWATLPTDVYTVSYTLDGKDAELKEPGTYTVTMIVSDAKGNFEPTTVTKSNIEVRKATVFADVPADAWYAEEVYVANQQGYIGGIGGTNLFAPMNDLTRADFACVLYRMAGGKITASEEDLTDENVETISQFTDVDKNAYYAKAVAWATEMGITRGYGDTFGSARTITTEEFATMLARYAKLTGVDTSVDTDEVLAGVADGDKVSSYARDAVAWAVESEYLAKGGNLIDPQGTIYRARAVKVVVDFQPEQLDGDLADNPNLDPEKK